MKEKHIANKHIANKRTKKGAHFAAALNSALNSARKKWKSTPAKELDQCIINLYK